MNEKEKVNKTMLIIASIILLACVPPAYAYHYEVTTFGNPYSTYSMPGNVTITGFTAADIAGICDGYAQQNRYISVMNPGEWNYSTRTWSGSTAT